VALLSLVIWAAPVLLAENPGASNKPIPDVPTLLQQARAHQKEVDKIRENYTYRQYQQQDELDGNGRVKKTETEEDEVFFVNGKEISRKVKKNGKELSADDQKKEQDRVNKEVEKAAKSSGKHSEGEEEVTISRVLAVVKISNPRREMLNGRSTISFDFVGDPKAKAKGREADIAKKISGTIWVDESDREVARVQIRFEDNYHIGGGLIANIQKGSSFLLEQAPINHEIWLPSSTEVHIGARMLLLKGFHQNIHLKMSEYQKFHADAVMQPGAKVISQ